MFCSRGWQSACLETFLLGRNTLHVFISFVWNVFGCLRISQNYTTKRLQRVRTICQLCGSKAQLIFLWESWFCWIPHCIPIPSAVCGDLYLFHHWLENMLPLIQWAEQTPCQGKPFQTHQGLSRPAFGEVSEPCVGLGIGVHALAQVSNKHQLFLGSTQSHM